MTKPVVPQLNAFDVSMDYNNTLQLVFNYCTTEYKIENGLLPVDKFPAIRELMSFDAIKLLQTYEQRYANDYRDVVTPNNFYRIAALDMLVFKINKMLLTDERDYKKYYACIDNMHLIINGYRLSEREEN